MMTPMELHDLVRELGDRKVLSVYLDTRITDPAKRKAWRPMLVNAIRSAREAVRDERDLAEFDRAAAHFDTPLPSSRDVWASPGWVAFVTPEGVRYSADMAVAPATFAAWRNGAVVSPYLRAFKQQRPVIVALVESKGARLFRYAERTLDRLEEVNVPPAEQGGHGVSETFLGAAMPAARGAVATEAIQRRRLASFRRLTTKLVARLAKLAGDESWVLIGGTSEWAHIVADALPRSLAGRVLVSTSLEHDARDAEIGEAAKHAASELRVAHGRALVERLRDNASGHGRAAAGVPAVQRALRNRAVDLLVVTPEFIRRASSDAEEAVRAALAQSGDIEVLSGNAAEELDRTAEGIAARLRFAIDTAPEKGSNGGRPAAGSESEPSSPGAAP